MSGHAPSLRHSKGLARGSGAASRQRLRLACTVPGCHSKPMQLAWSMPACTGGALGAAACRSLTLTAPAAAAPVTTAPATNLSPSAGAHGAPTHSTYNTSQCCLPSAWQKAQQGGAMDPLSPIPTPLKISGGTASADRLCWRRAPPAPRPACINQSPAPWLHTKLTCRHRRE